MSVVALLYISQVMYHALAVMPPWLFHKQSRTIKPIALIQVEVYYVQASDAGGGLGSRL